jgi:hypothetical protein
VGKKKPSFNANAALPTPGLPVGRRGRATNQMPSLYLSSLAGTCRVCSSRIDSGVWVSRGRNGGMVHSQCMGAQASVNTQAVRALQSSTKPRTSNASQQPKPKKVSRKKTATQSKFSSTTALPARDTKVDKSDLPQKVGWLVASTPCVVCHQPKGVKCVDSQMKWVHQARLDLFLKQNS